MDPFQHIAEKRIREGQESGAFDGLRGEGERIDMSLWRATPPADRAAATIMRNAGVVPEEIGAKKELARIDARLARDPGAAEAADLRRQKLALELKRDLARERRRA